MSQTPKSSTSTTAQTTAFRYTASGARVDVLNPDLADLRIEDIAAHLANMNRFGGAVRGYTVAEHCCLGAQFLFSEAATQAVFAPHLANAEKLMQTPEGRTRCAFDFLMHDAHEAYLQDIISPIKQALVGVFYRSAETAMDRLLSERFGFRSAVCRDRGTDLVHAIDLQMLSTEEQHFFGTQSTAAAPLPISIQQWTADEAEWRFLKLFGALKPVAEAA